MDEMILILGRISWNSSKQWDFEMFLTRISVERFGKMKYSIKMARMVFHTDSRLPLCTSHWTLKYLRRLATASYPFALPSLSVAWHHCGQVSFPLTSLFAQIWQGCRWLPDKETLSAARLGDLAQKPSSSASPWRRPTGWCRLGAIHCTIVGCHQSYMYIKN
jgi:hypothetical protein